MFNYGIGGQEVPRDGNESITDIPQNRTLIAQKLTADAPYKPTVVEGLKTVAEVFAHYKPKVDVQLKSLDGSVKNETLSFSKLDDFGVKGLVNQSSHLKFLQSQRDEYAKMTRQLKINKNLKQAIENPEYKEAVLNALKALLQEVEDAK